MVMSNKTNVVMLCFVVLCRFSMTALITPFKDRTGRQIIAIENDHFEFIFLFVTFCFKHDKQKRMHV